MLIYRPNTTSYIKNLHLIRFAIFFTDQTTLTLYKIHSVLQDPARYSLSYKILERQAPFSKHYHDMDHC